jgi:V8-like Glu-specific endopeptidase
MQGHSGGEGKSMDRQQITRWAWGVGTLVFLAVPTAYAQESNIEVMKQGLVIGSDDRQNVDDAWLNAHPQYRPLVDAIGIMYSSATQFQCTASYIGGGLAVTAGHCVSASATGIRNMPCDDITIQWGFRSDSLPYLTSRCLRVLAARTLVPYDYAVLEVWPLPRAEIRTVHNAGSSSGVTSPGTMFSHPNGRPLTWSGTCWLPAYASAIAHECDSEPGSSGALMLEDKFLLGVGIHYGHSGLLNSGIYLAHTPIGSIMDDRFKPRGRIVGVNGGCLDVTDANDADRTLIQLWNCSGHSAQAWNMSAYGTIGGFAGKCLDTPYSTNGTRVWLFGCHYGTNQMWRFDNAEIRIGGDKCLDVPGIDPSNSTPAQIWRCHGGNGQKWVWTTRHEIRNTQGKCLDAASFSPSNGTPVVLYECHGGANQMWDISDNGSIRGIGGLCVDVANGDMTDGNRLQLHDCNGTGAQQWLVRGAIRGLDGKCLDVQNRTGGNGAPVVVHECHGGANQIWQYLP